MNSTFPVNFLYLGGDKCGSTWLWNVLSQHPDVTLAKAKELFYFDRFYEKGPEWYLSQFPDKNTTLRTGEICHDYLYSTQALTRIAKDLPKDSRFIVTVRDPVDRTVSHWKYLKKIGRTRLELSEALEAHPQMVEHSMFGRHVKNAIDTLGADRVTVLDFGELRSDPEGFGRALSSALGIPFRPELPYVERVLEAQSARSPLVVAALRNTGWLVRRLGLPSVVSAVKSSPSISKLLYSSKKSNDAIDEATQVWLRDRFEDDQALLGTLVPGLTTPTSYMRP